MNLRPLKPRYGGDSRVGRRVGFVWGFTSITLFVKQKVAVTASFETTGLVGERPDAVVLAFAGTDPAAWQTLATDAKVRLTRDNVPTSGFRRRLMGRAARSSRQSR
jgi:hypothetical protein